MNVDVWRKLVRNLLLHCPFGDGVVRFGAKFFVPFDRRRANRMLQKFYWEIISALHFALMNNGIEYWIDHGSLLGLIREHGPISHDEDMDFSVLPNVRFEDIVKAIKGTPFSVLCGYAYNNSLEEIVLEYKHVKIDVLKCHMIGDCLGHYCFLPVCDDCGRRISMMAHERKRVPYKGVIRKKQSNGVEVCLPANAEEMLTATYGTWRIEDKKTDSCSDKIPCQFRDIYDGCRFLPAEDLFREFFHEII